jgi:hypothetical protein
MTSRYEETHARSVDDPERFWAEAAATILQEIEGALKAVGYARAERG